MAGGISIYHALLPITEALTASTLTVTVDNDTFDLTSNGDGTYALGKLPNPSNPVGIYRKNGANYMALRDFDKGDHRVVIQEDTSSIETTECFKKAVKSVSGILKVGLSPTNTIDSATWEEAFNVLDGGGMVFLHSPSGIFPCVYVNWQLIAFARTEVDSDGVYTNTYTWNSDGTVTYASQKYPSQS